ARVGYLSRGRLLALGTPHELKCLPGVNPPGTRRLEIVGADGPALLQRLRGRPGVHAATLFGQAVHAVADEGRHPAELDLRGAQARPAEPSLEDVFVALSGAPDPNGI